MAKKQICCYSGVGNIFIAPYDEFKNGTVGLVKVGNAKNFTVGAEVSTIEVKNMTTRAGGVDCKTSTIDKVNVEFTLMCHNVRNLAIAMNGYDAILAPTAIVDEEAIAFEGAIVQTSRVIDNTIPPVITDMTGTTTYVLDVDYTITESGNIEILEGTTIPAPTVVLGVGQPNLEISYTSKEQYNLELFLTGSQAYVIGFETSNIFDESSSSGRLYKVEIDPSTITFIGEASDAAEIPITGVAVPDTGVTGTGLSRYGNLKWNAVV